MLLASCCQWVLPGPTNFAIENHRTTQKREVRLAAGLAGDVPLKQLCYALLHSDLHGWPLLAMQVSLVLELHAGQQQWKEYTSKTPSKPYLQRLADIHLLLYLSKQAGPDLGNDIAVLLWLYRT